MEIEVRRLSTKWFEADVPTNYVPYASTLIGSSADGKIKVTADEMETTAEIAIVVASTAEKPLAVAQNTTTKVITITLGTDAAGDPDNSLNTIELIAEAINDDLDGFSASVVGDKTVVLDASDVTEDEIAFTDGHYGTPCAVAGLCLVSDGTYYVCVEGDNTIMNDNWRTFTLSPL